MEPIMLSPVQKKFIWAGVVCLSLLALFPPWRDISGDQYYSPFFFPPKFYYHGRCHIDFPSLVLPMGIVVLVTLTGVFLAGDKGQSSSRPSDKE
jgi:hypothetical protein